MQKFLQMLDSFPVQVFLSGISHSGLAAFEGGIHLGHLSE
jgi:hypothetical protein